MRKQLHIPYKLKHYIDILIQPGLTFSFRSEEGYKGFVTGKPLMIIYARKGAYGPGTGAEAYDQQSSYINQVFGFINFTDIQRFTCSRRLPVRPPKTKLSQWLAAEPWNWRQMLIPITMSDEAKARKSK